METTLINHFMIKILIAARPVDSIRSIAKRIGVSYGWTHKWTTALIDIGVFKHVNNKIVIQDNHQFYQQTMAYIKNVFGKDVCFHYSILQLLGITYCFTKTDSVFVWTKGGYNIGRSKEYYPIFVKIKNSEKPLFEHYCKKLDISLHAKEGIFFAAEFVDDFEAASCEGIPVDSLGKSIDFMRKYIYNFQPALEMIATMYNKQTGVTYREATTYA